MPTLTVATAGADQETSWLSALQAEFDRAVQAIQRGAVPSSLKPSNDQLTQGEWLAVLEAARREVAKR
jgi:hypothetical protein